MSRRKRRGQESQNRLTTIIELARSDLSLLLVVIRAGEPSGKREDDSQIRIFTFNLSLSLAEADHFSQLRGWEACS
jgi:hypothetical protein